MTSIHLLKSKLLKTNIEKKHKKRKKKKYLDIKTKTRTICRICNEDKANIPIFNNDKFSNLAEEIVYFSDVSITESDMFSKHVCTNCVDLLNGCILFRELCQKTNQTLNKAISQNNVKTETETICKTGLRNQESDIPNSNEDDYMSGDSYNAPSPEVKPNTVTCTLCFEVFCEQESYRKHACTSNLDVKPLVLLKKRFLCETCGKTTSSRSSLLIHMSTHENIFPYTCDLCPYQGRTLDLLRVHKRSHLADKPFKCSQCPKSATTASNLKKHMQHVHSTARPHKCTYCEKMFSYKHDVKRHIRDIHLREGTVECHVCFKKFNTKKILQGHKWKIHKIKGEKCGRLPAYLQCQVKDQPKTTDNAITVGI